VTHAFGGKHEIRKSKSEKKTEPKSLVFFSDFDFRASREAGYSPRFRQAASRSAKSSRHSGAFLFRGTESH
jgi:hypothetical protein